MNSYYQIRKFADVKGSIIDERKLNTVQPGHLSNLARI